MLIAGGLFDTVGSWGADRYLLKRLNLPAGRAVVQSYPAGHMFYFDKSSRDRFMDELRKFIRPAD